VLPRSGITARKEHDIAAAVEGEEVRFADSPVEGDGFEPSVPEGESAAVGTSHRIFQAVAGFAGRPLN